MVILLEDADGGDRDGGRDQEEDEADDRRQRESRSEDTVQKKDLNRGLLTRRSGAR